jgi:pectinesterase
MTLKLNLFILLFLSNTAFAQKKLTVAKDGTGNYTSVQQAFDAVPKKNKKPVNIYVKNGIYKEKIYLDSTKEFVTIIGEDKYNTILIFDDHTGKVALNGDSINTRTSWSVKIKADNFRAENITFENNSGFSAGQAVAMESDGDKAVFINCRFLGFQDVLFTNADNSRQFYKNCYIEGTTDFIFGSSTVWFEQCHIHSKKNSHITAASTSKDHKFGYIFNDCVLTGDTTLNKVSLGRPWRPYASVIYLHCYLDKHIMPDGWANWNKTDNYKTTRYGEYKNYGPGANISGRVSWAKQLSEEEEREVNLKNVFGAWDPRAKL